MYLCTYSVYVQMTIKFPTRLGLLMMLIMSLTDLSYLPQLTLSIPGWGSWARREREESQRALSKAGTILEQRQGHSSIDPTPHPNQTSIPSAFSSLLYDTYTSHTVTPFVRLLYATLAPTTGTLVNVDPIDRSSLSNSLDENGSTNRIRPSFHPSGSF